uniref:DNA topoisomerase n=1 Tax=viral metagenome TaxID=1070528 RepID=A0A6C0BR15_9ZZZZ
MTRICIIVESPHKCSTIQKYVGNDYNVIACYGHFRCIETLGDISKESYSIKFTDIKSKSSVISRLKKCINESSAVIIATDDDREGEAIGWHICDRFKLSLNTPRIIFNEITYDAISRALNKPTIINLSVVNAQKTRQVIDMLIGYKVSPQLWKSIGTPKLSAGRCQTPALKLIYDNYKTTQQQKETFRYVTSGYFTDKNIHFVLDKEYDTIDTMKHFMDMSKDYIHVLSHDDTIIKSTEPPVPFNTLLLQQASGTELKLTTKDTMNACQLLYERGYITYMRTDSNKFNSGFMDTSIQYIDAIYGKGYVTFPIDKDMISDDTSAHEAIRPTDVSVLTPEDVTKNASRIYTLIRNRTIMSCMKPMISSIIKCKISAPMGSAYTYKSSRIDFQGWNIVTNGNKTDDVFEYINKISDGNVSYNKITSLQIAKDVHRHYNESGLLRIMKTMGIGRPSTYSSIIETLKERKYVRYSNVEGIVYKSYDMEMIDGVINTSTKEKTYGVEKNKLVIQPLGVDVVEFLNTYYLSLFNYSYSEEMENRLDAIGSSDTSWYNVCNDCNNTINECTKKIASMEKGYKLDDQHTYINGKYGPVIKIITNGVVTFKPVISEVDSEKLKNGLYKPDDLIKKSSDDVILGEIDGHNVYIKSGKFGNYIYYNDKTYSIPKGNETLQLEEAMRIINGIREISPTMSVRTGPKGIYLMVKTKGKGKPLFKSLKEFKHDPYKCDISLLIDWMN